MSLYEIIPKVTKLKAIIVVKTTLLSILILDLLTLLENKAI
jgi:hypothetical protein